MCSKKIFSMYKYCWKHVEVRVRQKKWRNFVPDLPAVWDSHVHGVVVAEQVRYSLEQLKLT